MRDMAIHPAAACLLACVALVGACGQRLSYTTTAPPRPLAPSPSAVVIGQVPDDTKTESETPVPVPAEQNLHATSGTGGRELARTPGR